MSAATAESYCAEVLMPMGGITSRRPPIDAVVYSTESLTRHRLVEVWDFLGICCKGSNVVRS